MTSLTIENYVKAIYKLTNPAKPPASTGMLAAELEVSPGTVTSMCKTLQESGLAVYAPYEGIQLTTAGESLALRIIRRHRLIELFLVDTLDLTWDEVHDEAENMEHAVSEMLVDRIDQYLGFPKVDPHGDPIPTADGDVDETELKNLAEWNLGGRFRLVRVLDQSPEFLRFLSDSGLPLGTEGRVSRIQESSGAIAIDVNNQETKLARSAAEKLLVAGPETK